MLSTPRHQSTIPWASKAYEWDRNHHVIGPRSDGASTVDMWNLGMCRLGF
jgi:hypothetical protein